MVWIEVDDHQRGVARLLQAGGDVAHVDRGGEFERRVGDAQAAGAQADLLDRLLAGDVEHAAAGAGQAAAACSSRVDLPMPGSPPTSTAEAGTRPPPSTRSSSAMPVGARGGGSALPARPTKLTLLAGRRLRRRRRGAATTASSTMVFHSPQVSQRPAHFGRDRAAGLADEAGGRFGQMVAPDGGGLA